MADGDAPAEGMVKGPYVAESFPVSLDGQYVVVEMTRRPAAPAGVADLV